MKSRVSIAKCGSYDNKEVHLAFSKAIGNLGGMGRFVRPGQKVFLKLNLIGRFKPGDAATTHPSVVRAVIEEVRKAGGILSMGDSPGGAPTSVELIFKETGLRELAEEMDCPLINLSTSKAAPVHLDNRFISQVPISCEILESDVVISIAKLKTHTLTTFTGTIKNMFGAVPGHYKSDFHRRAKTGKDMSELLVDLYARIKPSLSIMDGILGMEGDGPSAGRPKIVGTISVSEDGLALDAVSVSIINMRPEDIFMIRFASEREIGCGRLDNIDVVGESLENLVIKDFQLPSSSVLNRFADSAYWAATYSWRPFVEPEKCETCHLCERSCPVDAIFIPGEFPIFDYDRCIRCFSCQELCPTHAVRLKPKKINYYRLTILNELNNIYRRLKTKAKYG